MDADHVERVVEAEPELQRHGQRAQRTGDDADRDRAQRGDEATGRGDGDQAGDRAGRGAERGGLAVADLLDDQPAEHRGRGGDHRVGEGDAGERRRRSSAEPALKPNQPNHSRAAPSSMNGRLCGRMGSRGQPRRLPSTMARARPAAPALMCTAVPPAKSSAPSVASTLAIQPPTASAATKPSKENTQCATGKYTTVAQSTTNSVQPQNLAAVGDRAGDQRRRDDGEHQLEHREGQQRDRVGARPLDRGHAGLGVARRRRSRPGCRR